MSELTAIDRSTGNSVVIAAAAEVAAWLSSVADTAEFLDNYAGNKSGVVMNDADKTAAPIGVFEQISVFAIKTCIVSVIISASVLYVADTVIENLRESVAYTVSNLRGQLVQTPIGGRQFWAKIEEEFDRVADPSSDLPPERKQKLVRDVRLMVARWRPFIDAAQSEMQKPAGAN